MSTLVGLKIQGVRNFGPETSERIKFYNPLTLIVGQNGCGKTTIIESLKLITSGEFPTGTNRGAAFIHDPKLAMETEVTGKVMLLFNSAAGFQINASRCMKASQKAKNITCSTIDTSIVRINPDGTKTTVSGKCVDFEREIVSYLAVSRPILDNVIFCHQEDSNWPLDEGKKVKEKFDAIFSATKYIKCLEHIKKLRKKMQDDVKTSIQLLDGLELWKKEADKKQRDLKDQQDSLTSLKDKKDNLQEQMVPIRKRLEEIKKIEERLSESVYLYETKKAKLDSLRQVQAELRAEMNEEFKCSDMELRRMVQDFQRDVDRKDRELNKVQTTVNEVVREITNNGKEIKKVQEAKTDLEFAFSNHTTRVKNRNGRLKNIVKDYSITGYSGIVEYDNDKASAVLSRLEEFIKEGQDKILSKKNEFQAEESRLQSEIDSLRKKEAGLEQEIKSKDKLIEDSKIKGRKIKRELELNELEFTSNSLEDIKEDLSLVVEEIKKKEARFDVDKTREDIESLKNSRRDVESKLEEKKRIVNKMTRQAKTISTLDTHAKEKEALEKSVTYLMRKHQDNFDYLIPKTQEEQQNGNYVGENIKNRMEACAQSLKETNSKLLSQKDQIIKKKTKLDTRVENHQAQIKNKESEVRAIEEKVMKVCKGQDLNRALENSKELKEKLTKDRGDTASTITVCSRFAEKLKQEECCPICHRDFGTNEEIELLVQELEDKKRALPRKLDEISRKLQEEETLYEQMVALMPQQEQADELRKSIAKLKSEVDADQSEIKNVNEELEGNSETLSMTQSDEEVARSMLGDVTTLNNNLKKMKQLQDQILDLKATLGSGDGDMTMDEAITQQNNLEEEIKNFRKRESDLQDKLDQHRRELDALKDRKLKLSTKELEVKTKLQETESLKDELSKLEKERLTLEEELEKAKEEVAPFKYQIERKNSEKSKNIAEKDKCIDAENAKLQTVRDDQKAAKDLQSAIQEYLRSGKEDRLKDSQQKLGKLEDLEKSLDSRKKMLEDDQRQLEKELSNQKERKRNLDDEMKIRDKEEEAKILEGELEELKSSMSGNEQEEIMKEKQELRVKFERMFSECAKIDGSSNTIEDEISKLQQDLRRKEIREAEKNYKEKFVEKKCMDVSLDDLNKYYTALDTAIMRFHSDKMRTINSIIRELWRTTYKGNDIDYIEIKTDESVSQGADKKRLYQYRVVMTKNGTEMDMRSRCSAGQKVLASLIIRMALAETFSSNCGILALDEPTTNLDCENVEALAQALLNIVEKRKNQKNFQLIVITHDFEFLQKLAMKDDIEHYYKVCRNDRGLSVIKRCDAYNLN